MDTTCPRCLHNIPNDDLPGKYPGAISRIDDKTEICSVCGLDEAIPGGNGVLSKMSWPIEWTLATQVFWEASRQNG